MSCRYKNEFPSYSGWCDGPKQDFSRCIQFLITAYENAKEKLEERNMRNMINLEWATRLCKVGDRTGYFHAWEHYSKPIEASPLIGGAPAGIFSCIFAIVEFADGMERVDPTRVHFCDESNDILNSMMNGEVSDDQK